MKKTYVTTITALSIAIGSAFAVPTAQVNFSMTQNLFFQDSAFSIPTQAGWYVEVILQQNNVVYDGTTLAKYDSYLVGAEDVGFYNPLASFHETGKLSAGGATSSSRTSVSWQFTTTTYDNYYASLRVFNNSAKGKATKYLVIPTWRQIITDPAAVTAIQTVNWISATNDRAYIKYDVPAVPEPMTMAMFGLGGLALVLRRKMKKSA